MTGKPYVSKITLGCRIGNVVFADCFDCPLPKCRYEMNRAEVDKYLKDFRERVPLVPEFLNVAFSRRTK